MKPDTVEWVRYAEEDYEVATILFRRRKLLTANTVSFHCQQAVEKYLKARLVEAGVKVPYTHDLEALVVLLTPIEPLWAAFQPSLSTMTGFAVMSRYPGQNLMRQDARFALKTCRSLRKEVRLALGLTAK